MSGAIDGGPAQGWSLTAHACRYCGGRILRSGIYFMCATCEARCSHASTGICGCGMTPDVRPKGSPQGPFVCTGNPTRGPSSPAAIVILHGANTG